MQLWTLLSLIVSRLCDHIGISLAEIRQLPSFTSSVAPSMFMCYVGTHWSPISFPLRGWFMASMSMFRRCLSCEESPLFSLLLSKNRCCNAALRQAGNRVTLSSRWDSWLTFPKAAISVLGDTVSTVLQVYKIYRETRKESCMLSHC